VIRECIFFKQYIVGIKVAKDFGIVKAADFKGINKSEIAINLKIGGPAIFEIVFIDNRFVGQILKARTQSNRDGQQ
jgi:hypothetical protein